MGDFGPFWVAFDAMFSSGVSPSLLAVFEAIDMLMAASYGVGMALVGLVVTFKGPDLGKRVIRKV